jgi:hypothetical protein
MGLSLIEIFPIHCPLEFRAGPLVTSVHAAPKNYTETRVNVTGPYGLNNALLQVHNENARAHLEFNLQRWVDKYSGPHISDQGIS